MEAENMTNFEKFKLLIKISPFVIFNFRKCCMSIYYGYKSDLWFRRQFSEMLYGRGNYAYLKWRRYKSISDKYNSPLNDKFTYFLERNKIEEII